LIHERIPHNPGSIVNKHPKHEEKKVKPKIEGTTDNQSMKNKNQTFHDLNTFPIVNANIQRRPLRSEAKKRPSGGGPFGPQRTGMTC